jgi:hypothetical protein
MIGAQGQALPADRTRWLAWALFGYAILLWIGTVHLGWHCAVDSEISALLLYPIWRLSGWLAGDREAANSRGAGEAG